jgi:hypothetical protein
MAASELQHKTTGEETYRAVEWRRKMTPWQVPFADLVSVAGTKNALIKFTAL